MDEVTSNKEEIGIDILNNKQICEDNSNNYDRHNYAKLKILDTCVQLQSEGMIINSRRLANILKKSETNIGVQLKRMSVTYPYLKRKLDPDITEGCTIMYEMDKQGISVYEKLKERYEKGLDLNLKRKNPQKVVFYKDGKPIKDVIKDVELELITD